ncbi:probable splicing factor, arginine/serine-rich 4 isoform X2 [Gordionus sp. m RMFG-2023]|uniref:probable splicing factor, arginine/serine-rich 4 isoform X2 n=1 Tax=Gordionus sp. m RMFG-2023 TaxID=3053472 RepID=UPI0031FBE24B
MSRFNRERRAPPADLSKMVSLKIGNLSFKTEEEDLKRIFNKYGDIGDVYIPKDHTSKRSRGFAFIRYYSQRDADKAIKDMDQRKLDGRTIKVGLAKYGPPAANEDRNRRNGRGDRDRSRSRSFNNRRGGGDNFKRDRDNGRRNHSRSPSYGRSRGNRRSPSRDRREENSAFGFFPLRGRSPDRRRSPLPTLSALENLTHNNGFMTHPRSPPYNNRRDDLGGHYGDNGYNNYRDRNIGGRGDTFYNDDRRGRDDLQGQDDNYFQRRAW